MTGICLALAADANILINSCRLAAQQYTYTYQEPIPVEQLVRALCDQKQVSLRQHLSVPPQPCRTATSRSGMHISKLHKMNSGTLRRCIGASVSSRSALLLLQGYTQYGGLRPFGVSLLYAGWDKVEGYQLYQSNPSGNYDGCGAC